MAVIADWFYYGTWFFIQVEITLWFRDSLLNYKWLLHILLRIAIGFTSFKVLIILRLHCIDIGSILIKVKLKKLYIFCWLYIKLHSNYALAIIFCVPFSWIAIYLKTVVGQRRKDICRFLKSLFSVTIKDEAMLLQQYIPQSSLQSNKYFVQIPSAQLNHPYVMKSEMRLNPGILNGIVQRATRIT